jgi:hypothetical protein
MKDYLRDITPNESDEHIDPMWTSFTLWDDCVLLQGNLANVKLPSSFNETHFYDRTSFEADINHIHLNAFFKQDAQPVIVLRSALTLLDKWERQLKKDYPHRNFHLLLSFDGVEVVLRFYCLRELEHPWVDIENLENYKEEGILVKII